MEILDRLTKVPLPTAIVFMILLWITIGVMQYATWAQSVFEFIIGMKGSGQ